MQFHVPMIAILSLAVASTRAALWIPEGYHITKVFPIPNEYQWPEAKNNPHVPLLYPTLKCTKKRNKGSTSYSLSGTKWYGVDEDAVKDALRVCWDINRMSKWQYRSWDEEECSTSSDGTRECKPVPGWAVNVKLPRKATDEPVVAQLHKLTGNIATKMGGYRYTKFEITNGVDTRNSSVAEAFPGPFAGPNMEPGQMFPFECEKEQE